MGSVSVCVCLSLSVSVCLLPILAIFPNNVLSLSSSVLLSVLLSSSVLLSVLLSSSVLLSALSFVLVTHFSFIVFLTLFWGFSSTIGISFSPSVSSFSSSLTGSSSSSVLS